MWSASLKPAASLTAGSRQATPALCEAQLTAAPTFCLRRNSCLTPVGSANWQQWKRRWEVSEQGGTAQSLTAEELRSQLQTAAEEGSGICWSLKEKLEAVLAEGGKSQLIPIYRENAETLYYLCQIKVLSPSKTELETWTLQSHRSHEQALAHTNLSLQQAVLKQVFIKPDCRWHSPSPPHCLHPCPQSRTSSPLLT